MEEATIQQSLEDARTAFMEWYQLKQDNASDKDQREDAAVSALLALSEVVSRSSMSSFGDLLSPQELNAVHQSLLLIRREEDDDIFKRSLHHAIQRLVDNFSKIKVPKIPNEE